MAAAAASIASALRRHHDIALGIDDFHAFDLQQVDGGHVGGCGTKQSERRDDAGGTTSDGVRPHSCRGLAVRRCLLA